MAHRGLPGWAGRLVLICSERSRGWLYDISISPDRLSLPTTLLYIEYLISPFPTRDDLDSLLDRMI